MKCINVYVYRMYIGPITKTDIGLPILDRYTFACWDIYLVPVYNNTVQEKKILTFMWLILLRLSDTNTTQRNLPTMVLVSSYLLWNPSYRPLCLI